MPQILHPQQQDDLCSQTYPQKMGIDNSRAADRRFTTPDGFFCCGSFFLQRKYFSAEMVEP
jgi:hypothetical protein